MELDLDIPEYATCLLEPSRYKVLYGGRGGGKSWAIATILLTIGTNRPIRVLCARELQVSIADSVHKLLSDVINAHPSLAAFYDVQNKAIYGANGTEFSFKGLKHNANEIKSYEGVDYCWVEEAQAVSDKSWELLIPTIRKDGSEIWICFNPKNPTDPTYQRFVAKQRDNSIVLKVDWRDNPFFPTVLEDERLHLMKEDEAAYEHIWEGEFDSRFSGAVYAKWMANLQTNGQITDKVKHDPEFPVNTIWDLGYGDMATIWFYQESPNEVLLIDYYENSGYGIDHYCDILKGQTRDGATIIPNQTHRANYRYNKHYVPQDAKAKVMAAAGRSVIEQALAEGVVMIMIPETTHAHRIDGTRKVLPKCWFNSALCADGILALMAYHFKYDEDRAVFKDEPYHDWSSHASTALELLPRVWKGRSNTVKELDKKALVAKFNRLRDQNRLDSRDPYRLKPVLKRK